MAKTPIKMAKTPIILIPGIQGTTLVDTNKKDFVKVWSGIKKLYYDLYSIELDPRRHTDVKGDVLVERSDVEDAAYGEIINYLRNRGYPVYIFGYDWRKSNLETARALEDFVKHLRKKLRTLRFSFLTHSMGCLVLSAYFKRLSDHNKIDNLIDKVIFTVPPFDGSVEGIFNLIIGRSRFLNSSDDFRKIGRTFPSIFELCPVYDGAVKVANNAFNFDIYNYGHWQQNPLNSGADDIRELYEIQLGHLKSVRDQNSHLYDLGQLPAEIRDRMIILAGIGEETREAITLTPKPPNSEILNLFGFPDDDEKYINELGDGTVHLKSAEAFKDSIQTFTIESKKFETRLNSFLLLYDWHSFFLNNGRVQNIMKRFLEEDTAWDGWYQSIGGGVELIS